MCLEDQERTEVLPGHPGTRSWTQTSAKVEEESYKTQVTTAGRNYSRGFYPILWFWGGFLLFFSLPILLPTDIANGNSFIFNPREFALALPTPSAHAVSYPPTLLPLSDLYTSPCQRKLPEKSKPWRQSQILETEDFMKWQQPSGSQETSVLHLLVWKLRVFG